MLKARLYPLKSQLRVCDIEKRLNECVKAALVIPYVWDNKPFLQIAKWQRCSPCAVSKFPWSDGTHHIEYVKKETRDGVKDFVKTSLTEGMPIPSVSHTNGIGGLPRQCTETNTETNTLTLGVSKHVFSKPTAEEVSSYGQSIDFTLDGAYFLDYYDARGWKIKGSPIKDWKACVRTWKKTQENTVAKSKRKDPCI
jgi:hypothetical protein